MEGASGAFNAASSGAGDASVSSADTGSQTTQAAGEGSPSPSVSANDNSAETPTQVSPLHPTAEVPDQAAVDPQTEAHAETEPSQDGGTDHHIDPETQALNDAQDQRLAEDAKRGDEAYERRQRFEEDLQRRYEDQILFLQSDIEELENTLQNSGPVRLAWLKFTKQVPQDPQADVKMLRSGLARQESMQRAEREAFETGLRREAEVAQDVEAGRVFSQAELRSRVRMSREQAEERLTFLESRRATPKAEAHLRPGGKAEQFSHENAAQKQEMEMSLLRAFVRSHDGANEDLSDEPESLGHDNEFGPTF